MLILGRIGVPDRCSRARERLRLSGGAPLPLRDPWSKFQPKPFLGRNRSKSTKRVISADFGVPRARSVGGLRRRPMHHLSSRVVARTMVHRTLDETPASSRTRTLKMAGNAPCTIPLRAVSGRFSGSRSPRCEGLIKRAMHHLSSREAGRKMLHRTPPETSHTSSTRYPKMAVFDQIAFPAQPPI